MLVVSVANAHAEDAADDTSEPPENRLESASPTLLSDLDVSVAVYGWLLSTVGRTSVAGADLNAGMNFFPTILENLESAFFIDTQLQYGRVGGFVNFAYGAVKGADSVEKSFQPSPDFVASLIDRGDLTLADIPSPDLRDRVVATRPDLGDRVTLTDPFSRITPTDPSGAITTPDRGGAITRPDPERPDLERPDLERPDRDGPVADRDLVEGTPGVDFDVDVRINITWIDFGASYRFGPYNLVADDYRYGPIPTVTIDPYVGGRFFDVIAKVDIVGGRTFRVSENWVDPIVGLRTSVDVNEHVNVVMSGDVGGFGVNSDLTWAANGLVGYRFGLLDERDAKVFAGYRAVYHDFETGSGVDRFTWRVTTHGPLVGLQVTF